MENNGIPESAQKFNKDIVNVSGGSLPSETVVLTCFNFKPNESDIMILERADKYIEFNPDSLSPSEKEYVKMFGPGRTYLIATSGADQRYLIDNYGAAKGVLNGTIVRAFMIPNNYLDSPDSYYPTLAIEMDGSTFARFGNHHGL